VRVRAGKLQLYGTQFTADGGELGPFPIEDPNQPAMADRLLLAGCWTGDVEIVDYH
jgi:hypothetical protein